MKQCNPELESLQQAVRDADKRALCSQEARVKAEAEAYRLEQERDELRAQHRKVLLSIAANDMTKFRGGQKRRDGLKPSQAAEPGNIWNTPKEIAENALKHMDLEDLALVHKGDS